MSSGPDGVEGVAGGRERGPQVAVGRPEAVGQREETPDVGDVPGVVFPCGLVHVPETDELRLYYGAADTCIAMATASLSEVLAFVLEHGVQPE